jgi:CshA-type fibril repeat protein
VLTITPRRVFRAVGALAAAVVISTGTQLPANALPVGPTAEDLTSTGVGTAQQHVSAVIPSGGTITLVNGESQVTSISFDYVGTFTLDSATGDITFDPYLGFIGAVAVTYEVTDAEDDSAVATYTANVIAPAGPAPEPLISAGGPGEDQTAQIPRSEGDSTHLIDPDAPHCRRGCLHGGVDKHRAGKADADKCKRSCGWPDETYVLVVADEGTYTLDPETNVITFEPVEGFVGEGTGVTYRVRDAYYQSAESTYTPTVTNVGDPELTAKAIGGALVKLSESHPGRVAATCKVTHAKLSSCKVAISARVHGKQTVIGRGHRDSNGAHKVTVTTKLTDRGRHLAARPGGVKARVKVTALTRATHRSLTDSFTSRIVTKVTPITHAVRFNPDSSALRAGERSFLGTLRHRMAGVKVVVCTGFTATVGGGGDDNYELGIKRAKAACKALVGKRNVNVVLRSYGEKHPVASNAHEHGRSLNRRVEIVLKY